MKKTQIQGENIYLKQLDLSGATSEYCAWLNDKEVNKYLETRKITIDELRKYIQEKNENSNCLLLGIFYKTNNKHIGNIKLEPIDYQKKKAEIGILIGDKSYWGKGIGTEATNLLTSHAFNILNLDEISLVVISENKAAIRVYQKSGFKIKKIDKKSRNHDGVLFDQFIMRIKKDKSKK